MSLVWQCPDGAPVLALVGQEVVLDKVVGHVDHFVEGRALVQEGCKLRQLLVREKDINMR